MNKALSLFFLLCWIPGFLQSQEIIDHIDEIQLADIGNHQVKKYWLRIMDNGMAQPIMVPVIIAKGKTEKPVLGLTAAIHGNELNGIPIIQQVFQNLDLSTLSGTLIGIPGLNSVSIPLHQRRFSDETDLNRIFPGKETGNRSQQYVWQVKEKILSKIDYLIDMHTASFGRENSLYVRADMADEKIAAMARMQDADIILKNKGVPSMGANVAKLRTMRAEAMLKGIPTITVEYGNPQVYQPDLIARGVAGIVNTMRWLEMVPGEEKTLADPVLCKKSYWIYADKGGYMEVTVRLGEKVKKDQIVAVLRNPFGDILKKYPCPEDGVVIGKSSNPVNMHGGRILHLGIVEED